MTAPEDAPAWADALAAEANAPAAPPKPERPAWADSMAAEEQGSRRATAAPHRAAPPAPHAPRSEGSARLAPPPADEPELSWAETGKLAAKNLAPSLLETGKSVVHAATHLPETAAGLWTLAKGFGSQAAGAAGLHQDPEEKAQTEAMARALEHHYAATYGSVKGFKRAASSDPAAILMDAATFVPGVGAGAKVAGLTKTAAVLGKVGSAIDPIANAVRVAKVPLKVAAPVARSASSFMSGVPASLIKVAGEAGASRNPAARAAFQRFYTGQGDSTEFLQTAQSALAKVRAKASEDYLAKKATLRTAQPSFKPIDDALAAAGAETLRGGVNVGQFKGANAALDDADALVNGWKVAPDPSFRTVEGFDNLKQAIWDLRSDHGNDVAQRHLGAIYNATKDTISALDPDYAKLMEQYQASRANLTDLQKTLVGAGRNPAATAALAKSLRAVKTGAGKNLLAQLTEHEPTLPYMLAGDALHPWSARGASALLEKGALPFALLSGAVTHDPVIGGLQLAGQLAGQSPKVAGGVSYLAGALGRKADDIAPAARGSYYADRLDHDAPERAIEATPDDVDAATRMVLSEAGGEPDEGKAAALYAALNRAKLTGQPLRDIIAAPHAFEGVSDGSAAGVDSDSPAYRRIRDEVVIPALRGDLADPTDGATHYLNPDLQLEMGRHIPAWAREGGQRIGRHVFFKRPEDFAERPQRAAGGRVDSAKVGRLVDRLMASAKAAKHATAKATKPLLTTPDATVARALEIAQRAI